VLGNWTNLTGDIKAMPIEVNTDFRNAFVSVKAQPKRGYNSQDNDSDVWDMRFTKGMNINGYIHQGEFQDNPSERWVFQNTAPLENGPRPNPFMCERP